MGFCIGADMTQYVPVKYHAAKHAIAVCKSLDECKDWADKAAAMQAYGKMAKDKELEIDAAEIRIRAERRLGELLAAQKAGGGLNKGGNPALTGSSKEPVVPTLADVGIDKKLSSRAQAIAAVPEQQFEAEVAGWREKVSAEGERVTARLVQQGTVQQSAEEEENAAEAEREVTASIETLYRIAEADDKLAEAIAALNLQAQQVSHFEKENARLMTENAELRKQCDYWRRKAIKAVPAAA